MASKRRSFSRELTLEAAALMTQRGVSITQASRNQGTVRAYSGAGRGRYRRGLSWQWPPGVQRGAHGSPRIHAELKDRQIHHGKKRVARLMRENGIRAKQKKKFKATTGSKHCHPVAPNLLQRNFEADMPDRKWPAGITYIPTREGWLYLAAIPSGPQPRVVFAPNFLLDLGTNV